MNGEEAVDAAVVEAAEGAVAPKLKEGAALGGAALEAAPKMNGCDGAGVGAAAGCEA